MDPKTPHETRNHDLESLKKAHASADTLFIDVREKEEWDSGHLQNALHLPLSGMNRLDFPEVPKNKQLFIYCRSGGRAVRAAALLQIQHATVIPLKYGFEELAANGIPANRP